MTLMYVRKESNMNIIKVTNIHLSPRITVHVAHQFYQSEGSEGCTTTPQIICQTYRLPLTLTQGHLSDHQATF